MTLNFFARDILIGKRARYGIGRLGATLLIDRLDQIMIRLP